MPVDIQVGPVAMWAIWVVAGLVYASLSGFGAWAIRDRARKGSRKLAVAGWSLWTAFMLLAVLVCALVIAERSCRLWPGLCG